MNGQIRDKPEIKLEAIRYIGMLAFMIVALSAPMGGAFASEPDYRGNTEMARMNRM